MLSNNTGHIFQPAEYITFLSIIHKKQLRAFCFTSQQLLTFASAHCPGQNYSTAAKASWNFTVPNGTSLPKEIARTFSFGMPG